jgi:proline dehydrogenase
MMRRFFLFLSGQRGIRRWMESSSVSKRLTARFVAGETLEEELAVCERLRQEGISSTLDHLGENVTSLEEAAAARDAYLEAQGAIAARGLPSTISIKLTQLGLDLSEDACLGHVRQLVAHAKDAGMRIEIDMESSLYTSRTLDIAARMAAEFGCVRSVIQAYLLRSASDIERLNQLRIPVRLCKGAYKEPPAVAFAEKRDVDENYVKLMRTLLERGTYPAIATHDQRIVELALALVRKRRIGPEQFEFQMLYGIRRDLQKRILKEGYRLRLYVPYGTAWYPYFMRRLAERPANALFLARHWFR